MTRMLLVGPPGSGKGTQAAVLADHLGVPAISTGDIFRRNVAQGTELGVLAKQHMDAGGLVPDEVTNGMVAARLDEPDARDGFLLDGYPRTLAQVAALDRVLEVQGRSLDVVVELVATVDEIVERLLKRAVTEGRSDDTADVIRRRMAVYAEQTAPLLAEYEQRGLLRRVDGMGSVEQVEQAVLAALGDPTDSR